MLALVHHVSSEPPTRSILILIYVHDPILPKHSQREYDGDVLRGTLKRKSERRAGLDSTIIGCLIMIANGNLETDRGSHFSIACVHLDVEIL